MPEIFSGLPDQEGDSVVVGNRQRAVVIPDPELLLADDRIRNMRSLIARSQWFGNTYLSLASCIEARKKVEAKMRENLLPWQEVIEPPCFVQYGIQDPQTKERLLVYGDIPGIEAFVDDEAKAAGRIGPDRDKFARRLRHRMEDALKRGWLYGQWYSAAAPMGEWGCQHKSVMQEVITEARFRELEANLWE